MNIFVDFVEKIIGEISNFIWPIFLPFMLILGLYLSVKFIIKIQPETSVKSDLKIKNVIGPASISLGAMVGTGAIIGVLGSLSKLSEYGQINIEAMAMWAVIGSLIMIPVSYCETVISKILNMTPKKYIAKFISPTASMIYCVAFVILYILGIGGFQFSGIDIVTTIITNKFLGIELSQIQRYLFIIIPIVLVIAGIVLSRKHSIFINSMTYMIFSAVVLYFIFFMIFLFKTRAFAPVFFSSMIEGMKQPISMMIGVPAGFMFGVQRVMQTAEPGIGTMAMAAVEADSEPREAGQIALIPTIITVLVAIVVTSYITSYGVNTGIFNLPIDGMGRLNGYFMTAEKVTGVFGLIVLSLFTLLSAMTTLLGSYFFLGQLFHNSENTNIKIYLGIIILAGTMAVFGFNIIFDIVDLLIFVVAALNMIALSIFAKDKWKDYRIKDNNSEVTQIIKGKLVK
ncbi:sodium:alanine symporter family protein [Clostridiaceae bacterium HSG29]|nr:sodium:alanine symporter family protein [Clostridiaceae bacterium HSG29]